jgi:hypothetical protein
MKAQETLERISVLARDKTKGKEALQLRALELLCKHHGLFTDKKVHEVGNYAQKLIAALSRVDGPDASDDDVHRADTDERPPRSSGKVGDKGKRARP